MQRARSAFASVLMTQAALVAAQEPICNPCVDGPEMFKPNYQYPRYPTYARAPSRPAISEADVLKYASAPYDKAAVSGRFILLGSLNGTDVMVWHLCPDDCPAHTVRAIFLDVSLGASCAALGGIEMPLEIPMDVTPATMRFCFPRVLVDRWDEYVK